LHQAAGLQTSSDEDLNNQINREKTYRLYNQTEQAEKFIDWADLPWSLQLVLLQEFIGEPTCFSRILCRNYKTKPIINWYWPDISDIIKKNQSIVKNQYSFAKIVDTFGRLMTEEKKRIGIKRESWQGRLSHENVIAFSLAAKNIRLLA
jgi:hypothetical protein